jgi:hypothetical protein
MRTISLFDVAQGLSKVRWRGDRKFSACCPAHDDRNPSFHARDVDGKILVKCFAGCSQDEVISALRGQELWPQTDTNYRKPARASKDVIWRHQMLVATELARAEQGISHTAEEHQQIGRSVRFLEACGYGCE